jgi:flagellar hook-associated protein 2
MAINFSGVASGMDTAAIVEATLATRRGPIRALEQKKSQNTSQLSDLGKLASKLEEFRTAARALGTTDAVLSYSIKSSDDSVVKASTSGKAMPGVYDLNVTQLAQAARFRSQGFAAGATVTAGELQIKTDGGDPVVVAINEGDKLADVAGRINGSGAGATATIVSDGVSSYLQLTAKATGHRLGQAATDALEVTEVSTGGTGSQLMATRTQDARNAQVTFGSGPGALVAQSRTNSSSSFISGVNLTFLKTGASTVEVAADKSGTRNKVQGFVDKANELIGLVKSMTETSDGARKTNADPFLTRALSDVRATLAKAVSGNDVNGDYNTLSKIGLRTTRTGRYELNSATFDKAYDADVENISRVFAQSGTGISDRVEATIDRYTKFITGTIPARRSSLERFGRRLDADLDTARDRLDKYEETMKKQFASMEASISSWQTQGLAVASMFR